MKIELQKRIEKIINALYKSKIKIIVDEAPDDKDHTYAIAQISNCFCIEHYDKAVETAIEIVEKEIQKYNATYTHTINDLSKSLLADSQFDLFLEVNSLNEKAIIKECGPKHFLFKTDWKETVWRKRVVNSVNCYLNNGDKKGLEKTIKSILGTYTNVNIDESGLRDKAINARLKHIELCKKYNLDCSIEINSINPYDFN